MKLLSIAMLTTLMTSQAMAISYPNKPAGSTPYFKCEFNDTLCGMANRYNTQNYASVNGGRALDQALWVNATTGSGQWGLDFQPVREIFVGFSWGTNADFAGLINSGNKVLFIKNPDAGDNSLLNWYGASGRNARTLIWHQQGIVDNCHVSGFVHAGCWNDPNPDTRDGTGLFFPNVNSAAATIGPGTGQHIIEIYLKSSTTNSSRDGIIRHWVDGVMTMNYTNVNLSVGGFKNVEFTATWDGSSNLVCANRNCALEWHHYLDDMDVSFPNGGNGGNPIPTPVILAKPANLRFI